MTLEPDDDAPVWDRAWPADWLEAVPCCPVCASAGRRLEHAGLCDLAFRVAEGRWTLWRCEQCRSAYLDPRPDPAHIGAAYGSYYTHGVPATDDAPRRAGLLGLVRRGVLHDFLNARFGSAFRPATPLGRYLFPLIGGQRLTYEYSRRHLPRLPAGGGRLLDFGCGNGAFLALAARMGWTVEGIEPDPAAVGAAQAAGLSVRCGGIELLDGRSDEFDCVTLNHVIEHVHDPAALLAACRRVLRAPGTLYIETPNIDAFGHRQFGPAWRGLEPPRHLVLFSRDALVSLLRKAGFDAIDMLEATDAFGWMAEESRRLAALAPARRERDDAGPTQPAPEGRQPEFLTLKAVKTA